VTDLMSNWTAVTAELPWGVQLAFKTALQAVADGDIKMVYGADSYQGSPCLVNAVNQMISHEASVSPSAFAGSVVSAFDNVNCALLGKGVNTDSRYVSPFAAEILLQHFGPMKPVPEIQAPGDVSTLKDGVNTPYVERNDTEMMNEWLAAQSNPVCISEDEAHEPIQISDEDLAEIDTYLK
jgi:hypothetical protein